jgi:hypothetical protein
LRHPAEQQVQLLQRCCSKAVDQYGHAVSAYQTQVCADGVEELVGDAVGRVERPSADPSFAMDSDADLHLPLVEGEGRLPCCGQDCR